MQLTQGQSGTSTTGPSWSTGCRMGLCRAELCGGGPWLLRDNVNSAATDEFYLRFKLAMSIPPLASWTQDTVVLRKSPVWVYSPCNYQVRCHLCLYHGYSACQKNLVITSPQDAWEAVMSPLHWPIHGARFAVILQAMWRVSQRAAAAPSCSAEMQAVCSSKHCFCPISQCGPLLCFHSLCREQLESCCFSWWHSAVSWQRAPLCAVPSWSSWTERGKHRAAGWEGHKKNKVVVWGIVWESLPLRT